MTLIWMGQICDLVIDCTRLILFVRLPIENYGPPSGSANETYLLITRLNHKPKGKGQGRAIFKVG